MFAPRLGVAYRPKSKWKPLDGWVIRGGYGVNYNTGQYATFARNLSHQEPFSVTQTNDFPLYSLNSAAAPTATGCTTTQSAYTYTNRQGQTVTRPATTANLSLEQRQPAASIVPRSSRSPTTGPSIATIALAWCRFITSTCNGRCPNRSSSTWATTAPRPATSM